LFLVPRDYTTSAPPGGVGCRQAGRLGVLENIPDGFCTLGEEKVEGVREGEVVEQDNG
jgi:hypothetical protein